MIVLMAGLPGTGKSTLARELAQRTSGRVVSKDELRHAVFAPDEIEYSAQQDDFCMELMLAATSYFVRQQPGRIILLDGRTLRRYQIENVLNAAASLHQPWRILECVCSEEAARQRLQQQARNRAHAATNRDFRLYEEVKSRFEAITLSKTSINTDRPLISCIEQALSALK